MNTPDKWIVVKITSKDSDTIYKVFASWYGGYLGSDSWKMNSGITKVEEDSDCYRFYGFSGSCYECGKHNYGVNLYASGVLSGIIDLADGIGSTIESMPEDTNWMKLL